MPDSVKWFDRRFNFDFPTGLYRQVIERLRGTPARVEDRIKSIASDRLSIRDGDRWSIKENIGHLSDIEGLFLGRLDDFAIKAGTLRPADLTNLRTREAGHNDKAAETLCAAFRTVRAATVKRLESLAPADFSQTALHPRLGVHMRLVDLMVFQAEHDDHHLARITELSELPATASMVKQESGRRSALVCDDKAYIRRVIGKVLDQVGVEVVGEAETGIDAVERYKELTPDLVMMDIVMPGMTGLDAVRKIIEFDPAARILICSGLGQEALVAEAMRAGAKGYVLKPFTLSDLMEAVQLAL
ncbi:MAG: response regulator [Gemmatimonadetes bacterium]|nr:response regulator [Gemmatimonadota bacterium]